MKRLFILRHAKSSWDDPAMADFDRPLNERGLAAAPFMGELMAGRGALPEIIVSSPAQRAKHTATLFKEAAGLNAPLQFDERIYEARPSMLITVLSELSDDHGSAMIVGHNPGMEGLVHRLTGELHEMPTAAIASVQLDVDNWAAVEPGVGVLEYLLRPKKEMKRAREAGQTVP